jgi:predicted TIM-barrel fold metal-dependent hydrolase
MRSQHLDPNGVAFGMLIPLRWNPGSQRNLDFGVALTQAMNTWQVERWVKNEPRLRASILIAQEGHRGSVAEIEARASDRISPRSWCCRGPTSRLGRRRYWPIFEAAARNNLADRRSCRWHQRSSIDRRRLAVLLHGRASRGRPKPCSRCCRA